MPTIRVPRLCQHFEKGLVLGEKVAFPDFSTEPKIFFLMIHSKDFPIILLANAPKIIKIGTGQFFKAFNLDLTPNFSFVVS